MAHVRFVLVSIVALLISDINAGDVTFKDVTVHGYAIFVHKFERKIDSSNSLKENLPSTGYDGLEIRNQSVPILYEGSVADLEDLDELTMENDGITEIRPGAFKNVPQLRKLSLQNNKLKEIKEGVFTGLSVSQLDLSKNSISRIDPKAFDEMRELLHISLADNKIAEWNPEWFFHTEQLARLSMQNNLLETLPEAAFKNIGGVRSINPPQFKLSIILSHNKIKNLDPGTFDNVYELSYLWLDNNELETVSEDLLKDIKIDFLQLDDNRIECLRGDLDKILPARSINLNGNPWDCECLEEVKEWAKKTDKVVELMYSEMECSAQRIRVKLNNLKSRLDELKDKESD